MSDAPGRAGMTWWNGSVLQDIRLATRRLARQPWSSCATIATVGLAIGITTAMFALVDALILRPVPFSNSEELALLTMRGERGGPRTVARPILTAWGESRLFAAIEAAVSTNAVITANEIEMARVVANVTPGILNLLGGVRPLRGRVFQPSDAVPGGAARVLISEDVWRVLYHGDPGIIGRSIKIDGSQALLIGVLPSDFRFPTWNTVVWRATDFNDLRPEAAGGRPVVYVRFASGLPVGESLRMATRIARETEPGFSQWWAHAEPLAALEHDAYYQRAVPLLSFAVLLLFIVLSANAGSLALLRAAGRRRELATRVALGASRRRLVREALVEGAMIGAIGIAAGLALGWVLVSLSRAFLPEAALLHSLNPLNIDGRAIATAAVAGSLVALSTGLLVGVLASRVDAKQWLRFGARRGTDTTPHHAARRTLLALQIALSCTLLLSATLLIRSFVNLATQERGLDTSRLLVARVELPSASFPTEADRAMATRGLEEEARRISGISMATWSYGTPPGGGLNPSGLWQSRGPGALPVGMTVHQYLVQPTYFTVYGIPILKGRSFGPSEDRGASLISERFAAALWPGKGDPIGQTFNFNGRTFHVIGLTKELRYPSLDSTLDAPQWYRQLPVVDNVAMLTVRCESVCPDATQVRQQLSTSHPRALIRVSALEDSYANQLSRPRATAALALVFATTALVAAATGLFGLLSHSVASRRREFGIRMAVGASSRDVRRLVWRDALTVMVPGLCMGAAAGILVSRTLAALLFGVAVTDSVNWMIVVGIIGLAIALATWYPARVAVKANPIALLREC